MQNGQNIVGDAANECAISVDPTNGNKMTIAWRQFNDVTSNFRQGGWGYTTDAGMHWTFPGVLQNNVFRSDPVTKSDETGQFFYLSLQSNVQQSFFCDDLWRSTNGGQTWTEQSPDRSAGGATSNGLRSIRPTARGTGSNTSQTMALTALAAAWNFNAPPTAASPGRARSVIPNAPIYGTLDVDTNGNVFVGGWTGGTAFHCVRSSNAQIGGQTPTFDRNTAVNLGGGLLYLAGSIRRGLAGQVFLAIDRSGGATNNNIYMLASVLPSGR